MRCIPEFQANWLDVVGKKLHVWKTGENDYCLKTTKGCVCVGGMGWCVGMWQTMFCEKWDVHFSTSQLPWNLYSSPECLSVTGTPEAPPGWEDLRSWDHAGAQAVLFKICGLKNCPIVKRFRKADSWNYWPSKKERDRRIAKVCSYRMGLMVLNWNSE